MLKRCCARAEARKRRADAANTAYTVALTIANATKVAASTQSWVPTLPVGLMNCGRNATKNTMPLGFRAVTRYVFANNRRSEPGTTGDANADADVPVRRSLIPRWSKY